MDRTLPNPLARRAHKPGHVQLDWPRPEATLTTVAPIGSHLVITATEAQALALAQQLARILEEAS